MTTTNQPGSVLVTPADMYAEMRAMSTTMTRMEGKLDAAASMQTAVADHESRLRTLERSRWPLPSLAAVCGVAGLVTGFWSMMAH